MRAVLFFLSLFFVVGALGQSEGPVSVSFIPKTGFLMAHRKTIHHLVKDRNNAFELEISTQDVSDNTWSKIYRHPSRGFSFMYHNFGYEEVLGSSITLFRFTKFPIYQSERFGFLDFRLGNGISYITKKYDKHQNKKNIAIGSHLNGFVNLQFSWSKRIDKFFLGAGVDFSHASNAKLKTPNLGLNTLTGFVTAGIDLEPRKVYEGKKYIPDSTEYIRDFHKWQFHVIVGIKQNLPDHLEARNFGVFALQGLYKKKLGRVWDAEFGIDLAYSEANRWFFEINPVPAYEALLAGAYTGLALSVYRAQVFFGLGVYGLNLINPEGWIYNRAGVRFNTNEKWNLMVAIKAHVGIADYLEWGVGYRF